MKALELANKQALYVGGELGSETAAELRRLAEVNEELLEALRLFLDATEGTACVCAKDAFGKNAWPKIAEAGNAARDAISESSQQQ